VYLLPRECDAEPLLSNGKGNTDLWEGCVKYAVEMGSDTMIYITIFHKDWCRHSKVNGGGIHTETAR
jgi:hypothetical protein